MTMYRPGTTAAAAGTAGFEAQCAPQAVASARPALPPTRSRQAASPGTTGVIVPVASLPCRSDPDLFFAESPQDVECAKALCHGCRARINCLAGAVERREPWGVWGGELFLRGEIVPRKRPRGRPRKTDVAA